MSHEPTDDHLNMTPAQIEALRERMNTRVDCRALAETFINERPAPGRERLMRLADAYGIDGLKTLTDIENHDAGDAYDVADEPQVHALRYVPIGRWTPNDITLMLGYGHGACDALWLAIDVLEDCPLIEARYYEGDLLIEASRVASDRNAPDYPRRAPVRNRLFAILDTAMQHIRARFERTADDIDQAPEHRAAAWARLLSGGRAPEADPYHWIADYLNEMTKARDYLDPPSVLLEAEGTLTYAHYRPRSGLEIVPANALRNPDVSELLSNSRSFSFKRATRFEITTPQRDEEDGVRLRHFSDAAIENHLGIRFKNIDEAVGYARQLFGVADKAWRKPR